MRGLSDATSIVRAVHTRETSARDVTSAALRALGAVEPRLRAFLCTFESEALRAADLVDARVAKGERPPLAGVPVAIKDNICLGPDLCARGDGLGYGGTTTAGSRILARYRSPFTATAAQRLIDAGAIVLGKTNLDEFGMGSSTEHSAFGVTRNPWDTDRVPGGSSGGSAAAVASGVCPIALGSDTGGSIRQPAAHCGVVGLKPTYGRVSRLGLIAYASSLDQVGPIASSVADAALCLQAIAGHDGGDATSAREPVPDYSARLEDKPQRLVVGVPGQARSGANSPELADAFEASLNLLRGLGAEIVSVDIPMLDHAIAAYYVLAPAEASSNLARYDGVRYGTRANLSPQEGLRDLYERSRSEGFGEEVKRRIMLGTYALAGGYYEQYYATATKVRRVLREAFGRALATCSMIATPATPGPAFRIGAKTADPLAMYLEDVYTVGVNLAGLPAVSVPMGCTSGPGKPLPLGLQLIGAPLQEASLLQAAAMFERARGPLTHRPEVTAI
ncbi:MAG: Asp-tRNA(Asn)/Glu-tRNA(Gln) amidotransferase subunit GatA [Leptolyngbya sp. PLA1]|nr:Asp-tRNA(Asn)/Glu-tRNA(Gln) amidotransferase subunit GatA [Leptolyngbya sp. PLA1]